MSTHFQFMAASSRSVWERLLELEARRRVQFRMDPLTMVDIDPPYGALIEFCHHSFWQEYAPIEDLLKPGEWIVFTFCCYRDGFRPRERVWMLKRDDNGELHEEAYIFQYGRLNALYCHDDPKRSLIRLDPRFATPLNAM